MAGQGWEFEFVVRGFAPDTIAMNRLVDYLKDVATLLGEHQNVHLKGIQPGSFHALVSVDAHAGPKVEEQLRQVRIGEGDDSARAAAERIDRRLAEDNASGRIVSPRQGDVYTFPGIAQCQQPRVGPISDQDVLLGVPIKIGGKGAIVPVHLQEPSGGVVVCRAHRNVARAVARHIFEQPICVRGTGKWIRDSRGDWTREDLLIHSFEPVATTDLAQDIEHMKPAFREFAGIENPLKRLEELRHG